MNLLTIFIIILFGQQAPPKPRPPVPPVIETRSDLQRHIDMLNREAIKRHVQWKVWCVNLATDWKFQGWAVQPGDDFYIYAEDGAKPSWNSHGATQNEAVYQLYLALQSKPDVLLYSSPERKHEICPPELRGGTEP